MAETAQKHFREILNGDLRIIEKISETKQKLQLLNLTNWNFNVKIVKKHNNLIAIEKMYNRIFSQ